MTSTNNQKWPCYQFIEICVQFIMPMMIIIGFMQVQVLATSSFSRQKHLLSCKTKIHHHHHHRHYYHFVRGGQGNLPFINKNINGSQTNDEIYRNFVDSSSMEKNETNSSTISDGDTPFLPNNIIITPKNDEIFGKILSSTTRIKNPPMNYSIFHGQSALRTLPIEWQRRLQNDTHEEVQHRSDNNNKALGAFELLLDGYLDAAHDYLLGVTFENILEGEFAATHRGQTSWSVDHPLTLDDDCLHSIIHRIEGHFHGEGDHTGFENAKYWISGGPKQSQFVVDHPVYQAMAIYVTQKTSNTNEDIRRLLVPSSTISNTIEHVIIATGNTTRYVSVKAGTWDSIAYIDLWKQLFSMPFTSSDRTELLECMTSLMTIELRLWRHYLENGCIASRETLLACLKTI